MSKRGAGIFVIVAVLVLGGIDIMLAMDSLPGNTYSERIREWGYAYRWLPYLLAGAFGALLTHWFGKPYRQDTEARPLRDRIIIAGALLLTVAAGMAIGFLW